MQFICSRGQFKVTLYLGDPKPVGYTCANCLSAMQDLPGGIWLSPLRSTSDIPAMLSAQKKWLVVVWCYDFFITGSSSNRSMFSLWEWQTWALCWALNFYCLGGCSNHQDILDLGQKDWSFYIIHWGRLLHYAISLVRRLGPKKARKAIVAHVCGHHMQLRGYGFWSLADELLLISYINQP